MEACDCRKHDAATTIVQLLMDSGAAVNVCDRYKFTPLMRAAMNNNNHVIRLLLPFADIDFIDCKGNTALYHAIENHNVGGVQLLLERSNLEMRNENNWTPYEHARVRGNAEILELFEPFNLTKLDTSFLFYTTYRDLAPTYTGHEDKPPYFPEIEPILYSVRMEKFIDNFARAKISFEEFLCITDKRLKQIGILFPFQRKRILLALLKFHRAPWTKASVDVLSEETSNFGYYLIFASHLKHLIIMKTGIAFLERMDILRNANDENFNYELVNFTLNQVKLMQSDIKDTIKHIKDIQSCNPKRHVLGVNVHYLKERAGFRWKIISAIGSIVAGAGLIVFLKVKNVF